MPHPQGNLETLGYVCASGSCDDRIVYETLATTEANGNLQTVEKHGQERIPPDFLPESFSLSKDGELDWFDRKESQKRNSVSNSTNLNSNLNLNCNSQRSSLRKSKASIIGLPKTQKSCFVETKNRKNTKPGNTRLFPIRSGSVKSDPPLVEPSSPKVSCMGRVRSKRDRIHRLKNNRHKTAEVETAKDKATSKRSSFLSSFTAIFRSSSKERESHALQVAPQPPIPRNSDIRSRLPPDDRDAIPIEHEIAVSEQVVEPVSLGGMKRLASGRRLEPLI